MKTIRQIADEIGVSKQAVFKKIKREPLSTSLQGLTATVDGRLIRHDWPGQYPAQQPELYSGECRPEPDGAECDLLQRRSETGLS